MIDVWEVLVEDLYLRVDRGIYYKQSYIPISCLILKFTLFLFLNYFIPKAKTTHARFQLLISKTLLRVVQY